MLEALLREKSVRLLVAQRDLELRAGRPRELSQVEGEALIRINGDDAGRAPTKQVGRHQARPACPAGADAAAGQAGEDHPAAAAVAALHADGEPAGGQPVRQRATGAGQRRQHALPPRAPLTAEVQAGFPIGTLLMYSYYVANGAGMVAALWPAIALGEKPQLLISVLRLLGFAAVAM